MFYNAVPLDSGFQYATFSTNTLASIYVQMSPKKNVYYASRSAEVTDDSDTNSTDVGTRRNLVYKMKNNEQNPIIFLFYMMSQIGGFIAFLYFTIGALARHVNQSSYFYNCLNSMYKNFKQKQAQEQRVSIYLSLYRKNVN
jgi:hypothetical protein